LEASFGVRLLSVWAAFSSLVFAAAAGDRIVLKDGLVFSGSLDLKDERIEVTERHRVVSISRTMLLNPEEAVDVRPPISFKMPQPVPLKPPRPLNPLSGYSRPPGGTAPSSACRGVRGPPSPCPTSSASPYGCSTCTAMAVTKTSSSPPPARRRCCGTRCCR
jgi:hypothetical protein